MDRLIIIDSAIRLLAIGQLLLIALVIGRGNAPRKLRLATGALLAAVSAYLALATPLFVDLRGPGWALIQLTAQATPLILWMFAQLLFERPIHRPALFFGVLVVLSCWIGFALVGRHSGQAVLIGTVQRAVSLGFTVHAIAIAIAERGDDLIEKRRRLRVGFVIVVGVLAVMVLLLEMLFGFRSNQMPIALPQAVAIFVASTAMGAALLQSDPELLFDPAAPHPPRNVPALSPSEHVLKQKLDSVIVDGALHETGLTIGQLAARLGAPEHRLRALINQRLGYRNFSAFLNEHRIARAKSILADPEHVDIPILTIAMDLGYGSLAPFNRAFRDAVGSTPGDYRRLHILQN